MEGNANHRCNAPRDAARNQYRQERNRGLELCMRLHADVRNTYARGTRRLSSYSQQIQLRICRSNLFFFCLGIARALKARRRTLLADLKAYGRQFAFTRVSNIITCCLRGTELSQFLLRCENAASLLDTSRNNLTST